MRKNWFYVAGAIACIGLFAACGNSIRAFELEQDAAPGISVDEAQVEQQEEYFLAAKDAEEVPVVVSQFAEESEYPELAAFLAAYYKITEEGQSETRYYYNYVDLNNDGVNEIFAVVIGEETEVSFGDPALILQEENGAFTVLESFEGIHTPVTVSERMTNGWHDIIYNEYGLGTEYGYRICRYNPEGGYQTEISEVVKEMEPGAGIQILANNLIDDLDRGKYLTLVPQETE